MNVKGKFFLKANMTSAEPWFWNVNRKSLTDNAVATTFFDTRELAQAEIAAAEAATDCEMILCQATRNLAGHADTSAA
jgi:hypothetical protein